MCGRQTRGHGDARTSRQEASGPREPGLLFASWAGCADRRRRAAKRIAASTGKGYLCRSFTSARARAHNVPPRAASSRASGARADSHNLHPASVRAWPAPAARKSRRAPAHILRLRAVCVLRVTYCVSFSACRFQHLLMFSCGVVVVGILLNPDIRRPTMLMLMLSLRTLRPAPLLPPVLSTRSISRPRGAGPGGASPRRFSPASASASACAPALIQTQTICSRKNSDGAESHD